MRHPSADKRTESINPKEDGLNLLMDKFIFVQQTE